MFDELYKEAYEKLKNEICSMSGRLLIEVNKENNSYYSGQLHAMNEVITIMNNVDEELFAALMRKIEKRRADYDYYESKFSADESRSKQL